MLVARRFGSDRWSTSDAEVISDYLYHISALPRGGEEALNALLRLVFTSVQGQGQEGGEEKAYVRPKCLARKHVTPADLAVLAPLTDTTSANSASGSSSMAGRDASRKGVPMLLMYGDNDWMAFPGAR